MNYSKPKTKIVLQWASKYKTPAEFVYYLEQLPVPPNEKGLFFLQVGTILYNHSNLVLAISAWKNALTYFVKIGDKSGESACYTNLGVAYDNLSDFRKAIEYYEKSLQMKKAIGDKSGESDCYANLGVAYDSLGDSMKAIEYYEKSLQMKKASGDKDGESGCYLNLGVAYYSLGESTRAIDYPKKSLQMKKAMSDFKKAIAYYKESLQIKKTIRDKSGESNCYLNLGIAYYSLGNSTKAIEYYEKSLQMKKASGDKSGEAGCYTNLGNAYDNLGDFRKAIAYHEKSLQLVIELGEIEHERIVTLNLGKVYSKSDLKKAYDYFKRSIQLSEIISGKLVQEDYTRQFQEQASTAYQFIVPLCLKLGKEDEAFEYVEGSKSRAIIELLAATKIRPTTELTNELRALLKDEEAYLSKWREIQTRHLRQEQPFSRLENIDEIREKLREIYSKMDKICPEYVSLRRASLLSLSEIADIVFSQNRPTVLIEYFLTEKEIIIFAIRSAEKKLCVRTVPITPQRLNKIFSRYQRERDTGFPKVERKSVLTDLSNYLIKPVAELLANHDLVYFVPYGFLHYLPLHALKLGDEPLIKTHAVAYSPSASVLKFCLGKGAGKLETCASFGVDFEDEAIRVAELFGGRAYVGCDATKENVRKNCDRGIIHFSCHGYFDAADPLSSGIKLHDGVLTAREVFDLKLDTEIVTLSACNTGINERSRGDELTGLTRAFLYAGAPSVVVSLWSVDSKSTEELMMEIYNVLKNGVDKATALQEAQKVIMKKEKYRHPYYWAPFILVGKSVSR
jgi:CHAT domain-containing protein/Flp pilus assembly protein TadD